MNEFMCKIQHEFLLELVTEIIPEKSTAFGYRNSTNSCFPPIHKKKYI